MKLVFALCLSLAALVGGATAAQADHIDLEIEDDAEGELLAVSVLGSADSETVAVTGLDSTDSAESDTVAVGVFGNATGPVAISIFGNACGPGLTVSITGEATVC